jgi:hypothetical protein
MRAPELTTALWEHCIRTRVYVTPYPANVHDVAGVDTNVPGGWVIVLEPASFGPIPATIDRTKKPIGNYDCAGAGPRVRAAERGGCKR